MKWHFYDSVSGIFSSLSIRGTKEIADKNCPSGHTPIAGNFNRLKQKFDTETNSVIDYDSGNSRDRDDRIARAKITQLELSQLRPERELRLDPMNETALRKIAEIDAKIAELRQSIRHG